MGRILNANINRIRYIVALVLIGAGVNLFLISSFGSDPLTVLQEGIHLTLKVSIGTASILYNSIIIIVAFIIGRKKIKWGTIVYSLIIGLFIDFFSLIIPNSNLLIIRVFYFSLGQLFISLGFALLIKCKLGMTAIDIVLFKIESLSNIQYKYLRSLIELTYVAIGWMLGGIVGIGTLVSAISTGYLINLFIVNSSNDSE